MNRFSALTLLSLVSMPLLGNDAAMNDGSEGPEPIGWRPGVESIIQMKSEHLQIRFGVEETSVLAQFTFLSHKKTGPARQKLGFPDASRSELDGDISGPISNLVTRVNGEVIASELVEGYFEEIVKPDGAIFYQKRSKPTSDAEFGLIRKYSWHVIEVEFPVGEEVIVEREYTCPTGVDTSMNSFFIYETRTGGAWKDQIERLTAEVSFDDTVRTDLVAFTPTEGWAWSKDKTMATLTWEDFEPRTEEDRTYFEISTLDVKRIAEIHQENPKDFPTVDEWIASWKKRQLER